MKKIYLFTFVSFIFFSCSKDALKRYDDRIIGNWYISDVNRLGIGGSSDELAFVRGNFIFNEDGTLTYTDDAGNVSSGTWDIQRRQVDDNTIRTLQISTVDFNTQIMKAEFYDEMNFRSTNHFVGKINTPFRTFVTHFRR
jgi:hypothetical protein